MTWVFAAVCILGPAWVFVSMVREDKQEAKHHPTDLDSRDGDNT